jgi:hypothetical protein
MSNKNNMMTCLVVVIVVSLIIWLTFKPNPSNNSCNKNKSRIIVPIGNGQNVALTKEQYQKLKENYGKREGFYVSSSDYIPNVQTENEYTPMLSLYKPKEPSRVIPEPTPAPAPGPVLPVPVPDDILPVSVMTGATGPIEGYGNVFIDNFISPSVDPESEKYRQSLTGISPFFLNNGKIMNGEAI